MLKWILEEIALKNFLSPKTVFIGAPHVQANANRKKRIKVLSAEPARAYEARLIEEINAERIEQGGVW